MPEPPSIRVYVPDDEGDHVMTIRACCEDPTPGVEPRKVYADLTRQQLYCANCDTDWMDFAWNTADVETIERPKVDDPDLDATVARHPSGKRLSEHLSCDGAVVTAGAKFWNNDLRVVQIAVVARTSNSYQGKATQTWHDTTDGGMFDTLNGDMRRLGRLSRYFNGKDAEHYEPGTKYVDVRDG